MHSISWFDSKESGVNINLFGQIVGGNPEVGAAVCDELPLANMTLSSDLSRHLDI